MNCKHLISHTHQHCCLGAYQELCFYPIVNIGKLHHSYATVYICIYEKSKPGCVKIHFHRLYIKGKYLGLKRAEII